MAKPLYLQQGHTYAKPDELHNWLVSEKFDGQRAFWDGGISRKKWVLDVPYANTRKDRNTDYLATGLWSRYGKVIRASDAFLDQLPNGIPLDLELWGGYDTFQQTTGIVRSHASLWWTTSITAIAFDAPPIENFLTPRRIDVPQADFYVHEKHIGQATRIVAEKFYPDRLERLMQVKPTQILKIAEYRWAEHANEYLDQVLDRGGEGLVYRHVNDVWFPERCHTVMKRKPSYTGTGQVIGHTDGKGKYEGMVGALIIKSRKFGEFQLSGMTDAQRVIGAIPSGTKVEFTYDSLTNAGIPRNGRLRCLK